LEQVKKNYIAKSKAFHKKKSLRLPELMIEKLKLLASKRDISYQSLMKIYLAERIQRELKSIDTSH
jgi:predicted DNA binding CopG/RHH family protein